MLRSGQESSASVAEIAIDPDFADILPRFVASREALLLELRCAVSTGSAPLIRRISHKLKGSFGLYGFLEAAVLCERLMNEYQTLSTEQMLAVVEQIDAELLRIKQAVIRYNPGGTMK